MSLSIRTSLLIMICIRVFLHTTCLAEERIKKPVSIRGPLIVALDDTTLDSIQCILQQFEAPFTPVEPTLLQASDANALELIQHQYRRTQVQKVTFPNPETCRSGRIDVERLVHDAVEAFEEGEEAHAIELLDQARSGLLCDTRPIAQKTLSSLFFLRGLARLRTLEDKKGNIPSTERIKAEVTPFFQQALLMETDLDVTRHGISDPEKQLFTAVRKSVEGDKNFILASFGDLNLSGYELWLDGVRRENGLIKLRAGSHFLQLIYSDNRVVSAISINLPPDIPAQSISWLPAELTPPSAPELLERLRQFAVGSPDTQLETVLAGMQQEEKVPWILLISPPNANRSRHVALLQPEQRPMFKSISQCVSPEIPRVSPVGVGLTIASGALTLASSATYGYFYLQGISRAPSDEEKAQILMGVGIGRVGMIVGLSATLVSGSLTWHIPSRFYQAKPESASLQPVLWLATDVNSFGLGLRGRW